MNLVQIQERLKDAPVQAIMQYANGGNPMVPPYLALAELKRRESINQSAQSQQAMQQGQAPSVKEQIEKAAGLAALQQQMQQQGLQGLMAQARPQGIPENVPQPRRQPESEGVAGLPAGDFNFADGGIVAFQGGGEAELKSTAQLRQEYEKARDLGDLQEASRIFRIMKMREAEAPRTVKVPAAQLGEDVKPTARAPKAPSPGMPPPAQQQPAAPAATGAATARGIAALPGADTAGQKMLDLMNKQSTPEEIYQSGRKLEELYGMTKPYGEERMKRAQAMEAARQQELESRGMERLMRVMGGIGARGLQGASPAYLQSIEAERAADAAFRKQMDELMGGVEAQRRAEQAASMQRGIGQMGEERRLSVGAAEEIYKAQRRREDEMAKIRLEHQLRMMQPNEAAILMRVIDDLRRRNPDKSEAEIYAMAQESKAGVTPELKREQLHAKAYNEAAKMWEEMIAKPKDITREQWIEQEVKNRLRMPSTASVPSDIDALLKKYGSK